MQIRIFALALSCGLVGAAVGSGGTWYFTRTVSGRVAIGLAEPLAHTVSWYQAHPAESEPSWPRVTTTPGVLPTTRIAQMRMMPREESDWIQRNLVICTQTTWEIRDAQLIMIGLVILFIAIFAAQHGNYIFSGVCVIAAIYALLFVGLTFNLKENRLEHVDAFRDALHRPDHATHGAAPGDDQHHLLDDAADGADDAYDWLAFVRADIAFEHKTLPTACEDFAIAACVIVLLPAGNTPNCQQPFLTEVPHTSARAWRHDFTCRRA